MKERFSSPLQAAEASYLQGDKIFMKTLQKIDTKLRLLWSERQEKHFISLSQARATEYSKARHHRMNEARRSSE